MSVISRRGEDLQPVMEALLLDVGGDPVCLGVVGQELVLDGRHFDKPAGGGLQEMEGGHE